MRTYGRVYDPPNSGENPKWVVVETDDAGFNDQVYLTTLAQCLRLNLNESPFYSNYGIPARNSVEQQLHPDFYALRTQTQFAGYFASLIISPAPGTTGPGATPEYNVSAVTNQGARLAPIAI